MGGEAVVCGEEIYCLAVVREDKAAAALTALGEGYRPSTTHQQEDGPFHQRTKYQYLIQFFLAQHKERSRVVVVEIEA